MLIAAIDDDAYNIVLVLHILASVVGLGAVFLNGLYGAQAKARQGAEGLAIVETNFMVSKVAEYFIYAILPLGIALVLMSDDVYEFDQTWIWLSTLLYVVALGLSHGVHMPTVRRMQDLMRELNAMGPPPGAGGTPGAGGPPPQVVELEALGKRVGATGAVLNLLVVVFMVLMIFKPGV